MFCPLPKFMCCNANPPSDGFGNGALGSWLSHEGGGLMMRVVSFQEEIPESLLPSLCTPSREDAMKRHLSIREEVDPPQKLAMLAWPWTSSLQNFERWMSIVWTTLSRGFCYSSQAKRVHSSWRTQMRLWNSFSYLPPRISLGFCPFDSMSHIYCPNQLVFLWN